MRAFIAIEIPSEVKKIFLEVQNQLDKDKAKLKITRDFHLTLKFLGEVDETKVEEIKKKLSEIKFDSFETSLTNIGVFPEEDYIRVIWIGLDDPKNAIKKLQQEIDEKLQKLGFKKDERFHPHVTLARVKFTKDKEGLLKNLKKIEFKKEPFKVNEFKLKKSTLTPKGSIYEDLGVFSAK